MSERLSQTLALNADFAKAYRRGEQWAVTRAEQIMSLDKGVQFPERQQNRMANHCGSCPYASGCMVCDLPYDPSMKDMIGTLNDGDLEGAVNERPTRRRQR